MHDCKQCKILTIGLRTEHLCTVCIISLLIQLLSMHMCAFLESHGSQGCMTRPSLMAASYRHGERGEVSYLTSFLLLHLLLQWNCFVSIWISAQLEHRALYVYQMLRDKIARQHENCLQTCLLQDKIAHNFWRLMMAKSVRKGPTLKVCTPIVWGTSKDAGIGSANMTPVRLTTKVGSRTDCHPEAAG